MDLPSYRKLPPSARHQLPFKDRPRSVQLLQASVGGALLLLLGWLVIARPDPTRFNARFERVHPSPACLRYRFQGTSRANFIARYGPPTFLPLDSLPPPPDYAPRAADWLAYFPHGHFLVWGRTQDSLTVALRLLPHPEEHTPAAH